MDSRAQKEKNSLSTKNPCE